MSHKPDRKLRSCGSDIIQLGLTDSLAGVFIELESDIEAYKAYDNAIRHLQACNCGSQNNPAAHGPSSDCLMNVYDKGSHLREKTPSLAELAACICSLLPTRAQPQKEVILAFCTAVADVLAFTTSICSDYFKRCSDNLPVGTCQLRDSFQREDGQNIWQGPVASAADIESLNPMESGCLFPGRPQLRPLIKFKQNKDQQQFCQKKYKKSKTHSPGLLTVQCVCKNHKIIGVIVMTQNESTALALSSVLCFFKDPPLITYYDNACNLRRGITTRLPFIFLLMKVLIDRFHFKSHICSSVFDPTVYPTLTYERTTTAESLNAVLAETRKHVRFLSGSNLIPFLRARMAIMNIIANLRESRGVSDVEDSHLASFFDDLVPCNCNGSFCISAMQQTS